MRPRLLPFILLFIGTPVFAQTPTVVTGTVTDVNGVPYSFAKVSAQLIPSTASPTIIVNGIPVQIGGQQNANADVNGAFSMNLFCNTAGGGCSVISPPGTQWQITANSNGVLPPVGTGPQVCTVTLTITGLSQNASPNFNACPRLTSGATGSGISPAITGDAVVILNSSGKLGDFGQPPIGITSVSATDNFIRPNENPIAAPWIATAAFPLLPQLVSHTMALASSAQQVDIALYSGIVWPNDQFVQSSIVQLKPTAGYLAWVLRCDAAGQNFYYVDIDASPGFGGVGLLSPLNLQKIVGGVAQGPPYRSFGYVTPQIGDVFRVQIIGTTISAFQNGALVGTFTDTTSPIASGSGGMLLQTASGISAATDVAVNNWSGGGIGTGAVVAGHLVNFSAFANQISDSGITGLAGALGAASITDSGLTPGNCVQAGSAGLLTTLAFPCAPPTAVQVFSATTLGSDVAVSATTPTDVMTRTITMPASGCPCRVYMSYKLYITTASSGVGYSSWVNDGSVNMGGDNNGQSNGSSGALTNLSYSGLTTVTYTNNTAVTFTLRTEGDHTYTVRAVSQLAGSAPNSGFQVGILTSN